MVKLYSPENSEIDPPIYEQLIFNRGAFCETVSSDSLKFLHIFWAGGIHIFVPDYLYKNVCITNSFGKLRECLSLGQSDLFSPTIINIMSPT